MAKRKRIILIFSYDQNWIGGSYYILNLLYALNYLEDGRKPEIYILSSPEDFEKTKNTKYPFLQRFIESDHTQSLHIFQRIINKCSWTFFKKDVFIPQIKNIDAVFPISWEIHLPININKLIYWIPDFQEKHLPENFNSIEIKKRELFQKKIALSSNAIVFSSRDASNDFKNFYPKYLNKIHVLNFAVTHHEKPIDFKMFKNTYKLNDKFFYCPNQFWKHKNHLTIFEAILLARNKFPDLQVVFTGNTSDPRNPNYFQELTRFISKNMLEQNILILGFVSREEQILLYKNAIAIVQPSLFEGWNTSIEDGKYFNQFIIASDIDVHKEQLDSNFELFPKYSAFSLSILLTKFHQSSPAIIKVNYLSKIHNFATEFMNIIEN